MAIDFESWDLREDFTTEEAAYLWLGLSPKYDIKIRPPEVTAMIDTLSQAIERGELQARTTGGRSYYQDKWKGTRSIWVWPTTYVSRATLRQWALKKNKRPKFLFPEDRTDSIQNTAPTLNTHTTESPVKETISAQRGTTPSKSRKDNLEIAIASAIPVLNKQYGRFPTTKEVFDYLAHRDEEDIVHEASGDKLVWATKTGKITQTSFKSLANRLSKYRQK